MLFRNKDTQLFSRYFLMVIFRFSIFHIPNTKLFLTFPHRSKSGSTNLKKKKKKKNPQIHNFTI